MDRRRSLSVLIVLVGVLLGPMFAFGWGEEGHQIIARIAEQRLSVNASRAVRGLLGPQSLGDVAGWADAIRKERPTTKEWHFVDIPITAERFDRKRDDADGQCIIDQINKFAAQVNDRKLPREQRQEALKFLVHFVGDIHQPLHCATRIMANGKSDRGGNDCTVNFLGRTTNLHRVWDLQLLEEILRGQNAAEYAKGLNGRITLQQAGEWGGGNPEDWANETHKVAIDHAYKGVPEATPPPRLGEDYVQQAGAAADVQMMKAGVRLAALLNQAFP